MARLSLYILAAVVTLVYVGVLHDEARWQANVQREAIQIENAHMHKAFAQHPGIWSQVHPMTYADLCNTHVHYGILDQTSANIMIHADAIRALGGHRSITYPGGPVPVITGHGRAEQRRDRPD